MEPNGSPALPLDAGLALAAALRESDMPPAVRDSLATSLQEQIDAATQLAQRVALKRVAAELFFEADRLNELCRAGEMGEAVRYVAHYASASSLMGDPKLLRFCYKVRACVAFGRARRRLPLRAAAPRLLPAARLSLASRPTATCTPTLRVPRACAQLHLQWATSMLQEEGPAELVRALDAPDGMHQLLVAKLLAQEKTTVRARRRRSAQRLVPPAARPLRRAGRGFARARLTAASLAFAPPLRRAAPARLAAAPEPNSSTRSSRRSSAPRGPFAPTAARARRS